MSKESYARGFCKAAAAAGVDPVALAKLAYDQYDLDAISEKIGKRRKMPLFGKGISKTKLPHSEEDISDMIRLYLAKRNDREGTEFGERDVSELISPYRRAGNEDEKAKYLSGLIEKIGPGYGKVVSHPTNSTYRVQSPIMSSRPAERAKTQ